MRVVGWSGNGSGRLYSGRQSGAVHSGYGSNDVVIVYGGQLSGYGRTGYVGRGHVMLRDEAVRHRGARVLQARRPVRISLRDLHRRRRVVLLPDLRRAREDK